MSQVSALLRPIKDLRAAEKARLPVSVILAEDRAEIVISHYRDEVWDFWPYIHQKNLPANGKWINWRVTLADGSKLTDQQHAVLLESAKDFIWSLWNEPIERRSRLSFTTVRSKLTAMKPLLRWMVGQGMNRFVQLDGRNLYDYVPVAKQNAKSQAVSSTTTFMRLAILEDLYLQRNKLNDALTVHPWPHDSAIGLAGVDTSNRRKPKTRRIPESVVRELAPKALEYVKNRAGALLDARASVARAVEAAVAQGVKSSSHLSVHRMETARELGFSGSAELNEELYLLRTACYIIIDLFSGIRVSEVLGLSRNCVSREKGVDGVEIDWIHGRIYKTDRPAHKWVVPPIVETAIRVMERYAAPYRAKLLSEGKAIKGRLAEGGLKTKERNRLVKRFDVVRSQADQLFLANTPKTDSVQVVSGRAMSQHLKAFCEKFNILGEDGQPWPLAPHQFRRTYAYFVASAELGDLQTLREHFGHWSLDMTLLYADGATDEYATDTDLLGEILGARNEKQEGVLHTYLLDDIPMANGDAMLADLRRTVRTAKNKDELIRQVSEGVVLSGTGHSWCIGNAKGSGCGGLCVFEADMCVDCEYGIIGPEHLPVWKEIAEQQAAALEMPDLGKPGKMRAQRIFDKAQEVIGKLEGTV